MSRTIWDEPTSTPLPMLVGNTSTDVCVIGLGGAGLAALTELAAHGVEVLGLDAAEIGGGAAGRNGGFLLAGLADFFDATIRRFGGDLASAIYQHTLDEIGRMRVLDPDAVRITGSLRIASTSDELRECEEHLQALRAHGFVAERYAGPEGTGLLLPHDGVYHPQRCLRAAAARLPQTGVRLFGRTPAIRIGNGTVETPSGTIACHAVIVALDGGLEAILPELKSRVRTARLQMLATAPASDVSFLRPVYCRHGYEYWQQLPSGEIALGGFRDRGGECEWNAPAAPGGLVQDLLEQFLRTHLKTAAPITHRWAACVGYTADRLPLVEEVRPRVYAVGGYCGTGNIASRLGGRAAAQLARGQPSVWAQLLASARARESRPPSPLQAVATVPAGGGARKN